MKHYAPEDGLTPEKAKFRDGERTAGRRLQIFGRSIPMPASRIGRIALGSSLVVGGVFSFLPILGVWMLPLGLLVLAQDISFVRRQRRKLAVRFSRRRQRKAEKGER